MKHAKKIAAIVIVVVAVISVIVAISMTMSAAQTTGTPPGSPPVITPTQKILLDEKFDSGLDGWSQYGATPVIVENGEVVCTNQGGIYTRSVVLTETFEMSFDMRFSGSNTWTFRVEMWSGNYRALSFEHSYGFVVINNRYYWPSAVVIGTTYHVKLAFDFETQLIDFFIDGALIEGGITFIEGCISIDTIIFKNDAYGTAFYDNILIAESL
jgi:hypothetical protein